MNQLSCCSKNLFFRWFSCGMVSVNMPKLMQFICQCLTIYYNNVSENEFVAKDLSQLSIILSGDFIVKFTSEVANTD